MGKFISRTITIWVVLCGICFVTCNFYDATNIEDTPTNKINQNNNMLSMMLETDSGSGQYEMTSLSSWPTDGYVFNSELSKCENGSKLSWDETNKQVVFSGIITDKCYVYFDIISSVALADYVISQYTGTQGENGLYHHDSSLTNGAGDNSYRFAGANPNNYVCFGNNAETCSTDNLYRIIGVIDGKVKLILSDGATTDMLGTDGGYVTPYSESGWTSSNYKGNGDLSKIGTYHWNTSGKNIWSSSTTNTTNLNTNYINNIGTKWKAMIDDTIWYVGGMVLDNGINTNVKTAYSYEIGANKDASTAVTTKIGMMYLSEYYYGATPYYWTFPGNNTNKNDYRKSINDNWMYIGLSEWTISRDSLYTNLTFSVSSSGNIGHAFVSSGVGGDIGEVIRPVFCLKSSVQYSSGTGTSTDPIRIKL